MILSEMSIETKLIHAGERDRVRGRRGHAIYQSSTYE